MTDAPTDVAERDPSPAVSRALRILTFLAEAQGGLDRGDVRGDPAGGALMWLARAALDGVVRHIRLDGDVAQPVTDPYAAFAHGRGPVDDGDAVPIRGLRLLPPAAPPFSSASHRTDHPAPVQAWLKSPRSVVPHGEPVRLRRDAGRAVMEAELAVVIGRGTGSPEHPAFNEENAPELVLGVTAVNDVSSRPHRARPAELLRRRAGTAGRHSARGSTACACATRAPRRCPCRAGVVAEADAIVSALPGTDRTAGLLGAEVFGGLRPGTIFVNVGRGTVVDEAAVLGALDAGRVGFAALDVPAVEPLPVDSPL